MARISNNTISVFGRSRWKPVQRTIDPSAGLRSVGNLADSIAAGARGVDAAINAMKASQTDKINKMRRDGKETAETFQKLARDLSISGAHIERGLERRAEADAEQALTKYREDAYAAFRGLQDVPIQETNEGGRHVVDGPAVRWEQFKTNFNSGDVYKGLSNRAKEKFEQRRANLDLQLTQRAWDVHETQRKAKDKALFAANVQSRERAFMEDAANFNADWFNSAYQAAGYVAYETLVRNKEISVQDGSSYDKPKFATEEDRKAYENALQKATDLYVANGLASQLKIYASEEDDGTAEQIYSQLHTFAKSCIDNESPVLSKTEAKDLLSQLKKHELQRKNFVNQRQRLYLQESSDLMHSEIRKDPDLYMQNGWTAQGGPFSEEFWERAGRLSEANAEKLQQEYDSYRSFYFTKNFASRLIDINQMADNETREEKLAEIISEVHALREKFPELGNEVYANLRLSGYEDALNDQRMRQKENEVAFDAELNKLQAARQKQFDKETAIINEAWGTANNPISKIHWENATPEQFAARSAFVALIESRDRKNPLSYQSVDQFRLAAGANGYEGSADILRFAEHERRLGKLTHTQIESIWKAAWEDSNKITWSATFQHAKRYGLDFRQIIKCDENTGEPLITKEGLIQIVGQNINDPVNTHLELDGDPNSIDQITQDTACRLLKIQRRYERMQAMGIIPKNKEFETEFQEVCDGYKAKIGNARAKDAAINFGQHLDEELTKHKSYYLGVAGTTPENYWKLAQEFTKSDVY